MCGRYVTTSTVAALAERLEVDDVRVEAAPDDWRPNYNVTPRVEVPIVAETVNDAGERNRVLDRVRWGLVPFWAKDLSIGDRQINARAEGIADKPAYRRAFAKRRCLIPADGFYEWKVVPGRKAKQPVFIHPTETNGIFAFAGVYEVWRDKADPDAPWVRTCAIITTSANDTLAPVHNRMPVILPHDAWSTWLDPDNHDTDALARLLVPAPDDEVAWYPIRTLVNKPQNNFAELLEPVPADAADDDGADTSANAHEAGNQRLTFDV
jgi:putative SOS response-associated peptidase YedK